MNFPLRACLCGEGFEHRNRWSKRGISIPQAVDRRPVVDALRLLRRECLRFRGHGQPVARPGPFGVGRRKRVVGREYRPAVVGDRRIKESTDPPIWARDWLTPSFVGAGPDARKRQAHLESEGR